MDQKRFLTIAGATALSVTVLNSDPSQAGTVANWKELNGSVAPVTTGLSTNDPVFGNGTNGNANSAWIAGLFGTTGSPESVTLGVGETLIVSGGLTLTGGTGSTTNYRFGVFNDGGQFALDDGTNWTGGWLSQTSSNLYQGRTNGAFISSASNAVALGATGTPTGTFNANSPNDPFHWSMSITRDSLTTVDLKSTITGGAGGYDLTYIKNDVTTSLFTYNSAGLLFGNGSSVDEGKLTDVHYAVYTPPTVLKVDFGVADAPAVGSSSNDIQDGFVGMDALRTGTGSDADQGSSDYASRTINGVTVSITADNGASRDRFGDVTGTAVDDVLEDFIFSSTGNLTLTLEGLIDGQQYELTTYHHDIGNFVNTAEWMIDQGDGGSLVDHGDVTGTNGLTPGLSDGTGQLTTTFTAGSGPVVITGTKTNSSAARLNGFTLTLVPEPSSLALLGLGGLLVARRRRG